MKKKFEQLLWKVLKWEAKIVLSKHKPIIVAITGSAGKTVTKDAIFHLLSKSKFFLKKDVRKTPGNLNTETGVPLSILGFSKEPKNIGWLLVIIIGFFRALLSRDYPEILILEMAADKKGDLAYLTSIAHPTISVITAIGEAHTEFFGDVDSVAEEKSTLIKVQTFDEFAILNFDNSYTKKLATKTKARVYFFGQNPSAHLYFSDMTQNPTGTTFKIHDKKNIARVALPTFGKQYLYAVLAAALCGKILNLKIDHIAKVFEDFQAQKGRGKIIKAPNHATLIDETYNSNPLSCKLALENLSQVKTQGRKIIALGDMLELGKDSAKLHQKIGRFASQIGDKFYFVGEYARELEKGVRLTDSKKEVFIFSNSDDLGDHIKKNLRKDDIILFKASRKIKMEKALNLILK